MTERQRLRGFAQVALVYVIVLLAVTLPSPLYALYQRELGLSTLEVTALFATYPVGVLLVLLFAGGWSDALGRRVALFVATLASVGSSLAFLLADGPSLLFLGRALTGLASGFVVAAANAALLELSPRPGSGFGSTVSSFANQLGLGLGALVAGFTADHLSAPTRTPFALHLVAAATALVVLAFVPETSPRRGRLVLNASSMAFPARGRGEALAACAAGFAAFAFCGLLAALAPPLVARSVQGAGHATTGLAVFLVFFLSAVSQPAWTRLRTRRLMVASLATLLVSLVALVGGVAAASGWGFFASLCVGGVGVGGVFMGSLRVINEMSSPDERGRTAATYFVATFSGLVVPVVGTGWAIDRIGLTGGTVLFCALVACVVVGCLGRAQALGLGHGADA